MRNKNVLLQDLPNVITLCQYLYMKEGNYVEVPGMVPGTAFRFFMDEDMNLVYKFKPNLGTGQEKWTDLCFDNEMSIRKLADIVETLKEMPAVEFPKVFKNRWEEVRMSAKESVSLNSVMRRR